jgi:hypothetical protein
MADISLNIFTNTHTSSPHTRLIEQTYSSFCDAFGIYQPTFYVDHHPNSDRIEEYVTNIKTLFPGCSVKRTESLSDGYMRSIQKTESAKYLFQLEGDWIFKKENIKHSLDEIIEVMEKENLPQFRFNKRPNTPAVWDLYMKPKFSQLKSGKVLNYCLSNNISNNPHIINKNYYFQNILKYLKIVPGSKGIEEVLNRIKPFESAIYGRIGDMETIEHLDGRGVGI